MIASLLRAGKHSGSLEIGRRWSSFRGLCSKRKLAMNQVPLHSNAEQEKHIGGRTPPFNPVQAILYHEPGRFVVVDKPHDVRMDGDFPHTVEKLVHAQIGVNKSSGLRFVQRLDYATSGVLLAALSRPAAAVAGAQFSERSVTKTYRALLHGAPPASGSWKWRIADEVPEGFRMVPASELSTVGRAAHTDFSVLRRGTYYGARVALVELRPRSGRRHQLRVHAAHADFPTEAGSGFPIVGDCTYAGDEARFFGHAFKPPRMMLHALELRIKLPCKDAILRKWKPALRAAQEMVFTTKCPFEDMEGLVLDSTTGNYV